MAYLPQSLYVKNLIFAAESALPYITDVSKRDILKTAMLHFEEVMTLPCWGLGDLDVESVGVVLSSEQKKEVLEEFFHNWGPHAEDWDYITELANAKVCDD